MATARKKTRKASTYSKLVKKYGVKAASKLYKKTKTTAKRKTAKKSRKASSYSKLVRQYGVTKAAKLYKKTKRTAKRPAKRRTKRGRK